jgi:hypothetical protein
MSKITPVRAPAQEGGGVAGQSRAISRGSVELRAGKVARSPDRVEHQLDR